MESNEMQLVALVNLLTDAVYPNPDDPGPIGPWGPWIRDALARGPLPDPWRARAAAQTSDGHWWQEHHPGPPPYWGAVIAALTNLAGHVDNRENPFGGGQPRPNWAINAMLRDLASLNPQPLPPVDSGIVFARTLASVALSRAHEAGAEKGSDLLHRFSEDWCGTVILVPIPLKPGDPGAPRPPRPQESLVLGAALIRAAGSIETVGLKKAVEESGRRIFEHGLSGVR
ncbi:hypothetical protein CDN99_21325 [Roseateles aquatilis]|uniref:Uncharacterized protein n=1 Tax=Roseateles aquatilis TaxID=431061 RepID=A0A246IZ42_9BURK|nr:hypothetical protein [Roseateles aquatilis]OWQ85630.1 hypothetical protein CDN99_21325 [Roseateles aquatilis]